MMSPQRVHKFVENLIEGDEDLFLNGLKQELSLRKHDLCKSISNKIFESLTKSYIHKNINETEDIKRLIEILSESKQNKSVKIQFKNASIINISESELESLKLLFDQLNEKNQTHMAKHIFDTPRYFKEILYFAKTTKGLLT